MSAPPTPQQLKSFQAAMAEAQRKIQVSESDKSRARDQLLRIRLMLARTTTK